MIFLGLWLFGASVCLIAFVLLFRQITLQSLFGALFMWPICLVVIVTMTLFFDDDDIVLWRRK